MPRRRASISDNSDSANMAVPQSKKRKRSVQYDVNEMCQELYDTIKNHRSADSRLTCEPFIRLPKKRTTPDYYEAVSNPIDLLRILQKIKMEEYEDVEQLTSDMELMCSNAKSYYKKNSQEYKDAGELWDVFLRTRNYLLNECNDDTASGSEDIISRRRANRIKCEDENSQDTRDSAVDSEVGDSQEGDVAMEEETERRVNRIKCEDEDSRDTRDSAVDSEVGESQEGDVPMEEDSEAVEVKTEDLKVKMEAMEENSQEAQPRAVDEDELEELFSAVMLAKHDDRQICALFQLLPSKTKYSEYYDVIKDPIDLKMIAEKIQVKLYTSLDALEKDMILLVKNAKLFNEPGSQIYKDADALKKIIRVKKQDIDNRRNGVKSSDRLRRHDKLSGQKQSALVAALQYLEESDEDPPSEPPPPPPVDDADDDSEDEMPITGDRMVLWLLYNTVVTVGGAINSMAEPFMKLPNRRYHADYYKEIKHPLSLLNIRKKLKHKEYVYLEQLASDLDLVFENAKKYNRDESVLFKNAAALQKIMHDKKREIETTDIKDSKWGEEEEGYTGRTKGKSRRSALSLSEERRRTPAKRVSMTAEELTKKRITELFKSVYDYVDDTGRELRTMYLTLPSKKDYPDYYKVISEPIDLQVIQSKIKSSQYDSEADLVSDFELMFNNARHYNEELSQVYQDANCLERSLKNKYRSYAAYDTPKKSSSFRRTKSVESLPNRISTLLNTIKEYADSRGRTLCTPFMKLPLKVDYPDYYEVIKKPMDLQTIQHKQMMGKYETIEDMVADFVQMFDNACKYNEPDSLIYKDALTLQRICLEKKLELCDEGSHGTPDVRAIVQEMMTSLFISVYNHQDEEGRCYVDSFADVPARHESDDPNEKAMSFDQVRWNLDKGRYRRMDRFQEDMFKVFERTRRLSRTDSQAYEDAVELQQYYMTVRDQRCKNGEILLTPALSYTERHLTNALDKEKKEKLPLEAKESEEKKSEEMEPKEMDTSVQGDTATTAKYNDQTYSVGDFVYIQPRDRMLEPHIVHIDKLFKGPNGEWNLCGYWYYRPNETFHPMTKKFLEKEVFKTDAKTSTSLSQIVGRCYIMFVKDYFKYMPEGFEEKDVYVCESRYSTKLKLFHKFKTWNVQMNDGVTVSPRVIPLVPSRVASVFVDKSQTGENTGVDGGTTLLDKSRLNSPIENNTEDKTLNYFEQYNATCGCLKLGDCVYVRSHDDRPYIAKIDKLWTDAEGAPFFYGPWYVRPDEVDHSPTRLFYHHEVFLSSIEDTNSVNSIIGKCSVLFYKDYCTNRITEIAEDHVYIVECKYLETERIMKKICKVPGVGLQKKYAVSPFVTDDEVYFFRHPIVPSKEPSPLLIRAADDFPDATGAFTFDISDALLDEYVWDPDKPSKRKRKTKDGEVRKTNKAKTLSGYIVFAGVTRKKIQMDNPAATFGDISRIVGQRWRTLSRDEKERFEEKAKKMAKELAEIAALRAPMLPLVEASEATEADGAMSPGPSQEGYMHGGHYMHGGAQFNPQYPTMIAGYPQPFYQHSPRPAYPHNPHIPHRSPAPGSQPVYPQSAPYTPHASIPGPPGSIPGSPHPASIPPPPGSIPPYPQSYPHQSYPPRAPHGHPNLAQTAPNMGPMPYEFSVAPRPPSPMFVSVPAKTQRLLHSEAYLKYIEGLRPDNRTVGDWDKSFTATPENTPLKPGTVLPVDWLAQGAGYHDNVVTALWALRDVMMRDTLNITRSVPFDSL